MPPERLRLPSGGAQRFGLAGIAGALAALGQAPLIWVPALFAGLALAIWLWASAEHPKKAALIGWAFGVGHFAVALLWIVEPFMIEPEIYGWMAPFALVFMAAGLALFWGGAFALAQWIAPRNGAVPALVLASSLAGAELLRAYVFTGFPWAMPVHGLIGGWMAQTTALWGVHGLQWLLMSLVALLVLTRSGLLKALCVASLALFLVPLPASTEKPGVDAPVVRLIQPNATQKLKWDPEMARTFFDRQVRFSAEGSASGRQRPDLIVWPETAVPILLEDADEMLAYIGHAAGAPVLLGIQRYEGMRLMNSAVLLGPDGKQRALYDKHHLVPFGEYVPFGDFMARFGIYGFAASEGQGYSGGPGPALMDFGPHLGMGLPLICYEAVFAQDVNAAPARPDFLVQITNDGWFGEISGPYQHLVQARFRAIEQGLPMVRVANTGVSAMIDAEGRVTAEIALNTAGWIDAPLPAAKPETLYARIGDAPVAFLILFSLISALGLRRRLT
jgi:apolipoprotein N-acyltransferase